MSVSVSIEDVSKRFRLIHQRTNTIKERVLHGRGSHVESLWALRDVRFTVDQGQVIGLLGHNGSGKSTLLRCASGILRPTTGRVRTAGRVAALLALGSGFHPELTGRQNVYLNASILGLKRSEVDRRLDEIIGFSELEQFIDIQVKQYSTGMYARLAFSVAVSVDPDILIIDEVLTVGDEAFQAKCVERIFEFKAEGRTILLVSHSAPLVQKLCDRAVVLDHGHLVADAGVDEGLRALREALGAAPGPPAEPHARPDGPRFGGVSFGYPAERSHVQPGEPLAIRVDVVSPRVMRGVVVALELRDSRDHQLLLTNSEVLGSELDLTAGTTTVSFRIAAMPPLHGAHLLVLRLVSSDGTHEYDRREGDRFEVVNPSYSAGLAFPLEVEVEPPPDGEAVTAADGEATTPTPVPCTATPGLLSEGPRWDAARGELLWVDILGMTVHRGRPGIGGALEPVQTITLDRHVGAAAPATDGGYVLAAGTGFLHVDDTGTTRELAQPEAGRSDVRMNDGACDTAGRFWAGTMAYDGSPGAGTLHRLELDGSCTTVLTGLTISNGIGWSPDGATMYLADSGAGRIDAFDFDEHSGEISRRRTIISIDAPGPTPDGLTVDEDGGIWVAMWDGGEVRRYRPDGAIVASVRLPVDRPTSCAFGGIDGSTLFVTTARDGLDQAALSRQPHAGCVFRIDGLGVTGAPCLPYRGPTTAPRCGGR
jgi:ABC-2 type transport system ATP-binding protein